MGRRYNHNKKINFFSGDFSSKFGTFTEFHKSYFEINKVLLGQLPNILFHPLFNLDQ